MDKPDWTLLGQHKCSNCPLEEETHPNCPMSLSLVEVIDYFKDNSSFEKVSARTVTHEREYFKETDLQSALKSLIGILMVTSGCPVLGKLRPMTFLHLPFASVDETLFKSLSTYLLAQFFIGQNGGEPDWGLDSIVQIYSEIRTVNSHFLKRLRSIRVQDASINALIELDCFAIEATLFPENHALRELESLFEPYLND